MNSHSICLTPPRSRGLKKLSDVLRKCLIALIFIRVLEGECKKFRVKLVKPRDVQEFLKALTILRNEKHKAENVLLDEVETDIEHKEKFISEQVKILTDMQNNLNTLIEHKNVVSVAS